VPRLAVLDESKQEKGHPILSVGGFVCDLEEITVLEQAWNEGKASANLAPDVPLKFSMKEQDPGYREALFRAIGGMPIKVLLVLLEDFRPRSMRLRRETRKDAYVHRQAFEYALQRIGRQYVDGSQGPHLVAFDHRDDFSAFQETYARARSEGWRFDSGTVEPLSKRGFAMSLLACGHGPLHEIADFIVGGFTLFANVRCCQERGVHVDPELEHQAKLCAPVLGRLPQDPRTGRRVGWSVVIHARGLTGRELLRKHMDRWLDDIVSRSGL
jgi:hypothetical protein